MNNNEQRSRGEARRGEARRDEARRSVDGRGEGEAKDDAKGWRGPDSTGKRLAVAIGAEPICEREASVSPMLSPTRPQCKCSWLQRRQRQKRGRNRGKGGRRRRPENEKTNVIVEGADAGGEACASAKCTSTAGIAGLWLEGLRSARLGSARLSCNQYCDRMRMRVRVRMRENSKRWRRDEREGCCDLWGRLTRWSSDTNVIVIRVLELLEREAEAEAEAEAGRRRRRRRMRRRRFRFHES